MQNLTIEISLSNLPLALIEKVNTPEMEIGTDYSPDQSISGATKSSTILATKTGITYEKMSKILRISE